jgi:hypothetical protein
MAVLPLSVPGLLFFLQRIIKANRCAVKRLEIGMQRNVKTNHIYSRGSGGILMPPAGVGAEPRIKKKFATPLRCDVINIGIHLTTISRRLSRFHTVHSYLNYNGANSYTWYNGNNGEETGACTLPDCPDFPQNPASPTSPQSPQSPKLPESPTSPTSPTSPASPATTRLIWTRLQRARSDCTPLSALCHLTLQDDDFQAYALLDCPTIPHRSENNGQTELFG